MKKKTENLWKLKPGIVQEIQTKKSVNVELIVFETPGTITLANIVTILIALCLLLPAIFFPPILLLNMPVLFLRYAYRQYFYNKAYRVKISFICPICNIFNPLVEKSGNLPTQIICAECGSKLDVLSLGDETI